MKTDTVSATSESLEKAVCQKVAELKSDLIRKGIINEDGSLTNAQQLPKSTDAAAIALIQAMENRK